MEASGSAKLTAATCNDCGGANKRGMLMPEGGLAEVQGACGIYAAAPPQLSKGYLKAMKNVVAGGS